VLVTVFSEHLPKYFLGKQEYFFEKQEYFLGNIGKQFFSLIVVWAQGFISPIGWVVGDWRGVVPPISTRGGTKCIYFHGQMDYLHFFYQGEGELGTHIVRSRRWVGFVIRVLTKIQKHAVEPENNTKMEEKYYFSNLEHAKCIF
jgi:hypothetical protein